MSGNRYTSRVSEVLDGLWAYRVLKDGDFKFRSEKNYRSRSQAMTEGRKKVNWLNKRR